MKDQNRSSAVMQQRNEPGDSLDDFRTPPFATRALCEFLQNGPPWETLANCSVREPCANVGHMAKPLLEYFGAVFASDIHDYGVGYPVRDYLFGPAAHLSKTHWTVGNPPFRLAEQFIERACELSTRGVAMLVRTSFLESEGRYERLFSKNPPAYVLQFTERVVMLKGRLVRAGDPDPGNIDPKTGKPRTASTATSYAWLVWFTGGGAETFTKFRWIKPCRRELERPGDYPEASS